METNLLAQTLVALFDLARGDRPAHMGALAERLGRSRREVVRALVELERRGLCQADRARLTLPGLALAASLRKQSKQRAPRAPRRRAA